MFSKRVTRFMALSVAAVLLVPCTTAFAAKADSALENMEETVEEMESEQEILTENRRLIAATIETILAGETVEYTNAAQVARLVQTGYAKYQKKGPFSITQGTMVDQKNGQKTPVYVVAISGTDIKTENQTTNFWVDFLAGFERDNKYVRNIKNAMLENIPEDSNIILTGHSLGGMVAQQIAAEKELKATYNILNTVTFGSPLIKGFSREGDTNRLGDKKDLVPYLSVSTFLNVAWQSLGLKKEDGNYDKAWIAHNESYQREDVWGDYDVTGEKNGSKSLILNFATTKYYQSPVTITEK